MTSKELFEHFLSKGTWVDKKNTVDQFISGDINKEIKKIAVTWMSDLLSIEWAIDNNIDLLITHEPTYFNHFKDLEEYENWDSSYQKKIAGMQKEKLIKESGLVIMRNHDVWDRFPEIGIPFAWAKFLGINTPPIKKGNSDYQHRYDIKPITLGELSKKVAIATNKIGQNGVRIFGNKEQIVSKIGIGTGCACKITDFIDMGCDVSIVCDDGQIYWQDLSFAKDANHPFIQVNHAISEDPGMVTMAKYINDNFADVEAIYLPHRYRLELILP